MKKAKYGIWIAIILVVVAMFLVYFLMNSNNYEREEKLAKCLSERGIVIYTKAGCVACAAQERDFGNAFQYLNIVECSENPEICIEKGILSVPSWGINGKIYPGRQSLEKLAELSGCEY